MDLIKDSSIKDSAIKWGEREDKAFNDLKTIVISESVLIYLYIDDDFYIDPDAS